ncbi:MAG: type III-A CRISPR-associated protein Csm2 [Desulfomonilia bacterium]
MVSFYKDRQKRIIDPLLFSREAEEMAKNIAEKGKDKGEQKKNKRSQIRKFYDEVLNLNMRAKSEPWEMVHPLVNMLVAKTAYSFGREYVTEEFLDFIKDAVNQVSQREDLEVFADFFEAFMGFYRVYGDKHSDKKG